MSTVGELRSSQLNSTQITEVEGLVTQDLARLLLETAYHEVDSGLEARQVDHVSVQPTVMQRLGSWVCSGVQTVKKALSVYLQSDLSLGWVTDKLRHTSVRDYQTAYELLNDYAAFRHGKPRGGETHDLRLSEDEKRAQDLYSRRVKLSSSEQAEFDQLLVKLHRHGVKKRELLYTNAEFVLSKVDVEGLKYTSRSHIQAAVAEFVSQTKGEPLTLDDHGLIELVVSRVLLLGMDENADSEQQIAFLA
jgi:hypothetical protein